MPSTWRAILLLTLTSNHRLDLFDFLTVLFMLYDVPGAVMADLTRLVRQMMSAVDVRMTNWHDTSRSFVVSRAMSVGDLRNRVGLETKLYFFDERNGNPRATMRRKLESDEDFDVLKEQPAEGRPVTVYYYPTRQGQHDPPSPPQDGQPIAIASADTPRSSSSRSTTVQNLFRTNVERRYSMNGDPVECLLCKRKESELRFAACHIIPYSCTDETFTKCGLVSGKVDGLDGVFFCPECHQFYDGGYWNWKIEETDKELKATVVVSEGLQLKYDRWRDLHNAVVQLGKGSTYPSKAVWDAGYRLNFSEPHEVRVKSRAEKGMRCVSCGKFYKRDYETHGCTAVRRGPGLMHTPSAHHPPQSGRGGRGGSVSQRGGRRSAGGRGPPVMSSLPSAPPQPAAEGRGARRRHFASSTTKDGGSKRDVGEHMGSSKPNKKSGR